MKRGLFLLPLLLAACTTTLVEGGPLGGPMGRLGHTLTGWPTAAPPALATGQPTPHPVVATPGQAVSAPQASPTPAAGSEQDATASPAATPDTGAYVMTMRDNWGMGGATYLPRIAGLVEDHADGVYTADASHRIWHFVHQQVGDAYPITLVAGATESGWVDAVGAAARFNRPHGLAIDAVGHVYVADSGNHCIRRIDPSQRVSTLAGDGTAGFRDGVGTARFDFPEGIAVDAAQNLYVADTGNHAIRLIRADGTVETLAGGGVPGYLDGPRTAARFAAPGGVCVASDGHVFVADTDNHCIREIRPAGDVSTLAGHGVAGRDDGTGLAAGFDGPSGLCVEASGSLLVADTNNHRIRRVFRNGRVVTIVGSGMAGALDTWDPLQAQLSHPSGVTSQVNLEIWIADSGNDRLRILHPGR